MGLLYLIGIIILIVWLARRGSDTPPQSSLDAQLEARNFEWAQFIANYYTKVKTRSEKALVERMLGDIAAQGLPIPVLPDGRAASAEQRPEAPLQTDMPTAEAQVYQPVVTQAAPDTGAQVQLDNTSLLLYFGAFLFVASAGLFVAFGGLPGSLRTLMVAAIVVVMYSGGIWLFKNRPKLEQAALTFVGMGMAVAPLIGLAAYSYVFMQSNGALVWFATSLVCAGLYFHALLTLRKPLISYILIFTFLSLFESGVSILTAPVYYYGWALAVVGIGLSIIARTTSFMADLKEPSSQSAAVFVPLAVTMSLFMVGVQGAGQLGVSLVIATAYYYLQMITSDTPNERRQYALVTQIAGTLGVATLAFALRHEWSDSAIAVTGLNVLLALLVYRVHGVLPVWRDVASVLIAVQFIVVFAGWQNHLVMFGAAASLTLLAVVVWLLQRRNDAYPVASVSWMALPVIFGLLVSEPPLSAGVVSLMLIGCLLVLAIAYFTGFGSKHTDDWERVAQETFILVSLAPLAASFLVSPWACLGVSAFVAVLMVAVGARTKDLTRSVAAGLLVAAPLLYAVDGVENHGAFLAATLVALAVNVAISLWYRQDANRWLSTALWLLLPVSVGAGGYGGEWTFVWYAWAYMIAMVGLILSRAIARGIIFISSTTPLAAYAKTASMSYVIGYWLAASAAAWLAILAEGGRWHATAIIAILMVVIYILSEYVEKWPDLLVLLPLFAQGLLFVALQPGDTAAKMIPYLLASSVTAVVSYGVARGVMTSKIKRSFVQDGAIIAVFCAPLAQLFTSDTYWPMPVGLLIAGVLLYYHVRTLAIAYKEIVGGVITLGIFWLMAYHGVAAIQAYVHVLIAQFGLYAYRRYRSGNRQESDQYIMVTLAVATIPLALQAISGAAGGLYGWWLLLEQVAIMLIGMTIGRRFVTMWGLYVAVGSVLYQLRNLGWAALTVLALFLIGLAVYKLQKNTDNPKGQKN